MENRCTSDRIIDGKRRRVIVDENGNIVNRNPSKEELNGLKEEFHKIKRKLGYIEKSICHSCIEDEDVTKDSILRPGNAYLEKDKNGNDTGEYVVNTGRDIIINIFPTVHIAQ